MEVWRMPDNLKAEPYAESVAGPAVVGRVDHFGEIHLDAGLTRAGWIVKVFPPDHPLGPPPGGWDRDEEGVR